MKKVTLYALVAALSLQTAQATLPSTGGETKPKQTEKAEKKAMQTAMLEKISKMSVRDYEQSVGHKLKLGERMAFKAVRAKAKNQLKHNKRDLFDNFNIGGFLLGLFLGLIGVLLAYIFSKDENLRKWSWIGLGIAVIIYLLILI